MNIAIGVLTSIIIGYMRSWSVDNAFTKREIKFKLSLKMSLLGILLVSVLFLYKTILTKIGAESYYFLNDLNPYSVTIFVSYCSIVVILISLLYKSLIQSNIIRIIILGSILFLSIGIIGYSLSINIVVMYFIISAYAEEYLKFSAGNNLLLKEEQQTTKNYRSDLVFFCILVGLGFSGIENVLYTIQNLVESLLTTKQFVISSLPLGRGLISTLIHVVCSGTIAYLSLYIEDKINNNKLKKIIPLISGLIMGVLIHSFYNISIYYEYKTMIVGLTIACYFLLSYFLFKSDIMFKKN